jgi:hypothetical protein
MLLCKVFY